MCASVTQLYKAQVLQIELSMLFFKFKFEPS